jgi:hypothetical protein
MADRQATKDRIVFDPSTSLRIFASLQLGLFSELPNVQHAPFFSYLLVKEQFMSNSPNLTLGSFLQIGMICRILSTFVERILVMRIAYRVLSIFDLSIFLIFGLLAPLLRVRLATIGGKLCGGQKESLLRMLRILDKGADKKHLPL